MKAIAVLAMCDQAGNLILQVMYGEGKSQAIRVPVSDIIMSALLAEAINNTVVDHKMGLGEDDEG